RTKPIRHGPPALYITHDYERDIRQDLLWTFWKSEQRTIAARGWKQHKPKLATNPKSHVTHPIKKDDDSSGAAQSSNHLSGRAPCPAGVAPLPMCGKWWHRRGDVLPRRLLRALVLAACLVGIAWAIIGSIALEHPTLRAGARGPARETTERTTDLATLWVNGPNETAVKAWPTPLRELALALHRPGSGCCGNCRAVTIPTAVPMPEASLPAIHTRRQNRVIVVGATPAVAGQYGHRPPFGGD
ncbi:hypothetical protein FDECE_11389, partial [Fusarium decemcellulare]